MGVDDDIRVGDQTAERIDRMSDQNANAVGSSQPDRTVGDFADDLHSALDADDVTVVVAQHREHTTLQIPQRGNHDRRTEVAREDDQFAFLSVEHIDCMPDVVDVIVRVRKNSNSHRAL